jgi:hypothetical protein
VLTEKQVAAFLQRGVDPGYFRRMLVPSSLQRWSVKWDRTFLLLLTQESVVPERSPIMDHLRQYETHLRNRTDATSYAHWYALRSCAYYPIFGEPKIVFPDISRECRFALETEGYFVPDGAFALPGENYLALGILNSRVALWYFRAKCASIGDPEVGGRLRFKKSYVETLPVPISQALDPIRKEIRSIARAISEQGTEEGLLMRLDELVLDLYAVPDRMRDRVLEVDIA